MTVADVAVRAAAGVVAFTVFAMRERVAVVDTSRTLIAIGTVQSATLESGRTPAAARVAPRHATRMDPAHCVGLLHRAGGVGRARRDAVAVKAGIA